MGTPVGEGDGDLEGPVGRGHGDELFLGWMQNVIQCAHSWPKKLALCKSVRAKFELKGDSIMKNPPIENVQ